MPRFRESMAYTKHGYAPQDVKEWRTREHGAGRPSEFDDFFRAHGLCTECGGAGRLISGVRWPDANGVEQSRLFGTEGAESVADARYDGCLKGVACWDYLYETCEVCGGSGKSKGAVT